MFELRSGKILRVKRDQVPDRSVHQKSHVHQSTLVFVFPYQYESTLLGPSDGFTSVTLPLVLRSCLYTIISIAKRSVKEVFC